MADNTARINEDVSAFNAKYDRVKFETPDIKRAYIADAEEIIGRYPLQSVEERQALAKFYSHLGCMITVFGQDLENGIRYYRKSIELDPESYDLQWEYYTTLEEIVEDENYSTPDLIQDAINCLTFCINYCDTPVLREKYYIHYRYTDLGLVYMAADDYRKAKECFERSMQILPNDNARNLLAQVNRKIGNPITRFFGKIFSVFRKNK